MAHILVVDDDRDVRGLVEFRLRKGGHQVLSAGAGAEALALVQDRGATDLAVLDVSMPGMSGLELLVELRKVDGLQHLPAIFLSARILPADIAAGRELGASYLTKPFVAPALMAAVSATLGPLDTWAAPPAKTPAPAREWAPPAARTPAPAREWAPPAPAILRTLTSRPPPGF